MTFILHHIISTIVHTECVSMQPFQNLALVCQHYENPAVVTFTMLDQVAQVVAYITKVE